MHSKIASEALDARYGGNKKPQELRADGSKVDEPSGMSSAVDMLFDALKRGDRKAFGEAFDCYLDCKGLSEKAEHAEPDEDDDEPAGKRGRGMLEDDDFDFDAE